jgi:hypothetical protein
VCIPSKAASYSRKDGVETRHAWLCWSGADTDALMSVKHASLFVTPYSGLLPGRGASLTYVRQPMHESRFSFATIPTTWRFPLNLGQGKVTRWTADALVSNVAGVSARVARERRAISRKRAS